MVNKIMQLFILIFIKSSRSLHYKFSTLPLNCDENWDVTFTLTNSIQLVTIAYQEVKYQVDGLTR